MNNTTSKEERQEVAISMLISGLENQAGLNESILRSEELGHRKLSEKVRATFNVGAREARAVVMAARVLIAEDV